MNTQQIFYRQYIGEIGSALSQLGNELQRQVQSNQPLNIQGLIKKTLDRLTYNLHNINADLDACRYNLIKDGKCTAKAVEIDSIKGALHHLLNGESYTHNGESTTPIAELYKMKFLIDSLYRLMAHGAEGTSEYIFDKITDKDR